MPHRLALSPHGRLFLEPAAQEDGAGEAPLDQALIEMFAAGSAAGLVALARQPKGPAMPAEFLFWREFAEAFLTALAHLPETADAAPAPALAIPPGLGFDLALRIPAMRGAEYATPEVFGALWGELASLAAAEAPAAGGRRSWLAGINPALHQIGRVTFHLAENKRTPAAPFAFMATYTHRLAAGERPVHLPLARALQEYAGTKNQAALRSLLEPVQLAAEKSPWAREQLESRRIFQPQAWTPPQAHAFLREVPQLEAAGIVTRIPDWWKGGRGPRPQVRVRVGEQRNGGLGLEALLSFAVEASLDGTPLTEDEWQALVSGGSGLVPLRGQWVEVDRDKLAGVLEHWKRVSAGAAGGGLSFLEGMRLLAGARIEADAAGGADSAVPEWSEVHAGTWLREVLEHLRQPGGAAAFDPQRRLAAQLRPYQVSGVHWLWFLHGIGLGACLADDMGLGKTIQVIALLLRLQEEAAPGAPPSLIVVPASLLANWKGELARFAPDLRPVFLHPSETPAGEWREPAAAEALLAGKDLALTTYGQVARLDWIAAREWRLVVLDEAQAIKNPGARQTRAVKRLRARARIALSGTPVENRLGDLWSLFDFLNPGLLGSAAQFSGWVKRLQGAAPPDFAPLRRLVRPYILRRLKTDRAIIADLPDKTEVTAWCPLAKRQAALYAESVRELARQLAEAGEGIQRRGLVLAFLMRFKQICNHPSQWQGDGAYEPQDSGKFQRLAELAEEIASRQEKVLVFTQFREMTAPLAEWLRTVFGRPGLILHGSTPVKERARLVADFQRDGGPPFFVLSLKAGGTGLNLTAASHVIHVDRWWNPAVENQATDRAFRIGQKRNVLVHKFVCRGTIEERIDSLIAGKRALADSILGPEDGAGKLLTEMSNDELLRFVALDLSAAGADGG